MELVCKIQNYEWGKKGSKSQVAKLYKNCNEEFMIDENVPYAELWMGTHVNGPSVVKCSGELLGCIISNQPECLGEKVAKLFNKELPFLFKVLSVNKALSIQAHPSKKHAEELHIKYPSIYKDSNHKPELAVALTPFRALCGFRPIYEIRTFINKLPELAVIIDCLNAIDDDTLFLKMSFKSVLTCDKQTIKNTIDGMLNSFKRMDENERTLYLADLVEELHSQFPYDNGILMVYFLNYLCLNPSEAIYLSANIPHAYISGDCIEIMACSDNVVRAGLTPKFIDVDTLCSMLIYNGEHPSTLLFKPIREDNCTQLFKPPVQDFALAEIKVTCALKNYKTIKRKCASIILVVNGSADSQVGKLKSGTTLFLQANEDITISNISDDLLIYQGLANV